MANQMYGNFLLDMLTLGLKGTSGTLSSGRSLSAAPTIYASGLKGYTFDVSHYQYSDFSAYLTEVQQAIDATDAAACDFSRGILWLEDGGPLSAISAADSDVDGILIWVDHGAWERAAFYIPLFENKPFSVEQGVAPAFRWPRDGRGIIELVDPFGSEWLQFYPAYWGQMLAAMLGGSTRTSLRTTVTPYVDWLTVGSQFSWGDKYKADIPDAWWAISPPTPKSWTATVTSFTSMVRITGTNCVWTTPNGEPGVYLLHWDDTGVAATSQLIFRHPAYASGVASSAPMHGQSDVTLTQTNAIASLVPVYW